MAYCPECNGEMKQSEAVCPHCGHDFSKPDASPRKEGFAYSSLADLSLAVGIVAAGIACLLSFIACIVALAKQQWLDALVYGPIVFLILMAVLVTFLRAQDLGRKV